MYGALSCRLYLFIGRMYKTQIQQGKKKQSLLLGPLNRLESQNINMVFCGLYKWYNANKLHHYFDFSVREKGEIVKYKLTPMH